MEEFNKQLEEAKKVLIEKTECDAIVLFGSFYRGNFNDESDVDIAIRTKKELTTRQFMEISEILENIFKRDVDLINLDKIQDGFRYEILINGRVIYCKNKYEFDLYKLDMFREYLELNESRQMIIDKIKRGEYLKSEGHNN